METDRKLCLQKILDSEARFKMIAAGAGTGKSYTFKELLKRNPSNNLALTFINNLVTDMAKDLDGLAEVMTFHSFCKKILHTIPSAGIDFKFHFFPKIMDIVSLDADFLDSGIVKPENAIPHAFQNLMEDGNIQFFLDRSSFYNAVGFDDSVYRVLKKFQTNPEYIPLFNHIVIDEFQDFNALEVTFINELQSRSPILIVGDDDQSVYDFKNASPVYLRNGYNSGQFERFSLPYCSRCTKVIVDAANHIISKACENGLLKNRISKTYVSYTPSKEQDSEKYPQIIHARCSVNTKKCPYIGKYIERAINEIPQEEKEESLKQNYPLALILAPSLSPYYLKSVYDYLHEKLPNIQYKPSQKIPLSIFSGYSLLLKNNQSNLGWRIIAEMEEDLDAKSILNRSYTNKTSIVDEIELPYKQKVLSIIPVLYKVNTGVELSSQEEEMILNYFNMSLGNIAKELKDEPNKDDDEKLPKEDIPIIRLTNYIGSKGLSAGNVFIIGLEEEQFPINNSRPTDNEVCQLIVAVTRTRQRCHLISVGRYAGIKKKPSVFLQWFPSEMLKTIEITAATI